MIYRDRFHAGRVLAEKIGELNLDWHDPIVLGIPRGGVPVGYPVARTLDCPLDVLVLRKLPIPQNDQMGFGAVTLDKKTMLNARLVHGGYVSQKDIQPIVDEVYEEVLRRDREYRGDRPFPELAGRTVMVVDDGLATGYTMLAGLEFVKSKSPDRIVAAVPVAHANSYELVKKNCDDIVCPHVDHGYSFAVASFYGEFEDLTDQEVLDVLDTARKAPTTT
ncbi:MAG: phosphoribosyltransferase [Desulfatibacillaceae bacterium]